MKNMMSLSGKSDFVKVRKILREAREQALHNQWPDFLRQFREELLQEQEAIKQGKVDGIFRIEVVNNDHVRRVLFGLGFVEDSPNCFSVDYTVEDTD